MGHLGIKKETKVVIYISTCTFAATYTWHIRPECFNMNKNWLHLIFNDCMPLKTVNNLSLSLAGPPQLLPQGSGSSTVVPQAHFSTSFFLATKTYEITPKKCYINWMQKQHDTTTSLVFEWTNTLASQLPWTHSERHIRPLGLILEKASWKTQYYQETDSTSNSVP